MAKWKKIILVLFSFITIFALIFSVPVSALSPQYTFDFPIARPDLEDFSVFLEILYSPDGGSSVRAEIVGVVAPYTFNNANAVADSLKVTISKTNFVVSVPENSNLGALSWFYMKDTGQMYFLTGLNSISQGLTQVLSIRVYGNAYVVDNHGSMSSYSNFVFNYGTDAVMDDKLDSIIAILRNSNSDVISNANQNASQIQQNQDKNTDKIIQNQQQLQENEKNEAQISGSGGADDVSSAVPDKSAGFTSALSSFVQSMSTTDTKCEISIPAFIVPKLDGLLPEVKLLDEQKLDFSTAIALIPSAVLALVRALTTIALIVFSFKELYGTIEYVLTLRRGGTE